MLPQKHLVCVEYGKSYFGWGLVCGVLCRRKRRARQIRASMIAAGTYHGYATRQYHRNNEKNGKPYTPEQYASRAKAQRARRAEAKQKSR